MKKIPLVFVLVLMLQGCIPAAFVVGAATGVVVFDHRSAKTMVQDRDIVFQVQSKLNADPKLRKEAHLSIVSFNHIALLVGQVPTEELRTKAEEIVRSNSKIKMLHNEVTIEEPISQMARANDTWITTKVKTVLAGTSGLNSTSLKIITENKVVYLMGLTSRTQATLAAKNARTVSGITKVVKLFEYLN